MNRSGEQHTLARPIRIPLVGLACSAEDGPALKRALSHVSGVTDAYVNCVTDTAYLDVEPEGFSATEAARVLEAFGAKGIRRRPSGVTWKSRASRARRDRPT